MREKLRKAAWRACAPGLIALALAAGGCGSSSPATAVINLESAAIEDGVTRPNVRCGWGSIWFPLKWDAVPKDAKELVIYTGRYKYVKEGGKRKLVVPFGDLISLLKPSLRRTATNVLPDGAGWSRIGVESCPQTAKGERVVVVLLALDKARIVRRLKYPIAVHLTEEALKRPHSDEGAKSPGPLTDEALAIGWLNTTYTGPHY